MPAGAWPKLWDYACGPFERDDMIHDAIDYRGGQIEKQLEEAPATMELAAEIDVLEWVLRRHEWMLNMSWREIDRWIRRYCPGVRQLPRRWRFTQVIKEAFRERLMAMEGGT